MPSVSSPSPIPGPESTVSRREWCVLAFAIVIAILVRCAYPSRVDVEHFDEGVYAANLYSAETDFKYPYRDLYAPPLLPEMASWGVSLANDPAGAVWVGILGGILLIPVVWWTAREWFGPLAAGSVALLAATSDYHAWLSRTALTDAWLCVWMTAGAYAGWRAMLSGRPLWLLAAGSFAALAWWTKYNGWLTLAIIGGGWLTSWVVGRLRSLPAGTVLSIKPATLRVGAIVAIAVTLWSPVWKGLAPLGGYAAVARNHAGYFVGLAGWWESFETQIATQRHVSELLTLGGIVCGVGAAALCRPVPHREWIAATTLGGLMLLVAGGVGIGQVWMCFGLLGILTTQDALQRQSGGTNLDGDCGRWLAWGFATAWLLGLWVAVPLYRPYPRLALPWLVGCWLAISACCEWWLSRATSAERHARSLLALSLLFFTWLAMGFTIASQGIDAIVSRRAQFVAWEDRTHLRRAAGAVREILGQHLPSVPPTRVPAVPAIVYVVGEPALYVHLADQFRSEGPQPVVLADAGLGMVTPGATDPRVPTYIVIGGRSARDLRPALQFASARLVFVDKVIAEQSGLVLLDDYPAPMLSGHEPRPRNEIEVYYLNADR